MLHRSVTYCSADRIVPLLRFELQPRRGERSVESYGGCKAYRVKHHADLQHNPHAAQSREATANFESGSRFQFHPRKRGQTSPASQLLTPSGSDGAHRAARDLR
jgi:hypothetical protein